MTAIPFSIEQFNQIDNLQERQRATIDQFNDAMEREDSEVAKIIAHYVLDDNDISNALFSRGWQMHCLNWLTAIYLNEWRESEDGSEAEEASLEEVLHCLWKYKWLVGSLPTDLGESREDMAQAVKHMADLYKEFRFNRGMVDKALLEQAMLMGDFQAAKKHFQKWRKAKSDEMTDCEACETNTLVSYYHFIGDFQQAVLVAEPILSGEQHCGEIPHLTYFPAISSLIQLGKLDLARDYLQEAIELITEAGESFLHELSKLIQLVNQLNDREWAESLLDDWSEPIVDAIQNNRFDYLQYLLAVSPLNQEALSAAQTLAKEFDERNGNRYYQNQLALMFTPPTIH